MGENAPPPNVFYKIISRYIFIVTMDYIDKSDVDVFSMKLTLMMYRRENGFYSKLSNFQQKEKKVFESLLFCKTSHSYMI